MEELVQKIIDSNESVYDDCVSATVDGYEFDLWKDPDNNDDWYIQVNPEAEGFLYDGWWNDSSDKSVEDAVREAILGAGILDTDMKNCIKVRVLIADYGWRDIRMERDTSVTDVPEKAYRPIPGRDTELMATARCALPVYEFVSVENTVTDCTREFEVIWQGDVWPGNEE